MTTKKKKKNGPKKPEGAGKQGALHPNVERKESDRGGRGLFTTAAFQAGQTIVSVKPAVSVIFDAFHQYVCGFCFSTDKSCVKTVKTRIRKTNRKKSSNPAVW